MKGVWIVGTDTEVGKTYITAQIVRHLRSKKKPTYPMKPIQSGSINNRSPDLDTVLQIANINPTPDLYQMMCPYMFQKAASPHLAARLENRTISIDHIVAHAHTLSKRGFLCIEGCGGLLVPINQHETMFDLLQALPLPIIVVVRGGLGTINHTLLTLNLLKNNPVAGIIINDTYKPTDVKIRQDNPKIIASFGKIPILADLNFGEELDEFTLENIVSTLA